MCRYFRERGREKVKGGVFIETKSSYGDINFNIYWSILWYEGRSWGEGGDTSIWQSKPSSPFVFN
jgi:hypothetical protein